LPFFPEIAEKRHERGGALSGGQQQMLTAAQGLVRRPRLLILDESCWKRQPTRTTCRSGSSGLISDTRA